MDIEFRFGNIAYGQAATVQADKAFAQNIGFEFSRQCKPYRTVKLASLYPRNLRSRHDMPAHDVSADFIAETGGTFEIDGISRFQTTQIGLFQGFFHQIKADRIAVDLGNGQAAAVVGDGCADLQMLGHPIGQLDDMGTEIGGRFADSDDFADTLDDTCKHGRFSNRFI